MLEDHYPKFNKIIDEFEQDSAIFSKNKEIITYYPQIFLLSVASTFEKEIKEKCSNIINAPAISLATLSSLNSILHSNINDYSNAIFKKFRTRNSNYDAIPFYDVFGGTNFKTKVVASFEEERELQALDYAQLVASLTPLIGRNDTYDYEYTKNEELYELFNKLDFLNAETSFLKIKEKRNFVAHDFNLGISDSFADLRKLYYEAVIYVIAIKKELSKLSTI